jgi:hypothetical protein
VNTVVGDAKDKEGIKVALREHDIEAVIDVAGNMVWPWQEYSLPSIAKAVSSAAIEVGQERGRPLRAWITSGIAIMDCPRAAEGVLIQDYFPKVAMAQHNATRLVIQSIPTTELRWSLLAISTMRPVNAKQGMFEPLDGLRRHKFLVRADELPDWRASWLSRVPVVGWHLDILVAALVRYATVYEDVADFLAEDLESGGDGGEGSAFVGKKVALKEMGKVKSV